MGASRAAIKVPARPIAGSLSFLYNIVAAEDDLRAPKVPSVTLLMPKPSVQCGIAALALVALVGCNGGDTKTADNSTSTPSTGTTPNTSSSTSTPTDASTPVGWQKFAKAYTPDQLAGLPAPSTAARKMPTAPTVTASGDTIKIGLIGSISGDQKAWGDDEFAGAHMAVDEFNAAGGLNGKKVELVEGDSASKAESAKSAAEKVLGEGVIGIIGEVASGNTIQIAKSAFEKSVPVVAVGATRTSLTDEGAHVFRVCYTDDVQGPVMAKFAYDGLGLRKVAIMTDNKQPYSQGLSDSFKAYFTKLGGQIVGEKFYETGQTQFSGQLTELKALAPDGMFLSGYFPEVGPIAQQARQAGINAKLLGGDGWDSPQLLTSGGDAIIGSFFCNHYNSADATRPQVAEFLDKWKKAHGGKEPGTTMAALGYDAAMVLLQSLKQAKSPDSKSLIDALNNEDGYKGVSGDITLKGHNGNPPKRALVVEVTKPAS